jgi:hypothetical protein
MVSAFVAFLNLCINVVPPFPRLRMFLLLSCYCCCRRYHRCCCCRRCCHCHCCRCCCCCCCCHPQVIVCHVHCCHHHTSWLPLNPHSLLLPPRHRPLPPPWNAVFILHSTRRHCPPLLPSNANAHYRHPVIIKR